MLSPRLQSKWESIKAGCREVISERDHEDLIAHFSPLDTTDSALFFHCVATVWNTKRVGLLDALVAYLKLDA